MKWLNSNKKGDANDDNLEFDYESWKITSVENPITKYHCKIFLVGNAVSVERNAKVITYLVSTTEEMVDNLKLTVPHLIHTYRNN